MKTKTTFQITCLLLPMLVIIATAGAQQQAGIAKQSSPVHAYAGNNPAAANYTYHVFQAPNKNFGYDILKNGKLAYHEFASLNQPENSSLTKNLNAARLNNPHAAFPKKENLALSKKEHAEKAALLAIEKMKKRESPALNQDEIRKIVAQ
jgi:hypothetical protein